MPSRLFMSSGDMVADRRFDYARDLQLSGDLVAAEDLFVQATDLAPGFATAWFTLGEVREQLGDRNGAITAFRTAEAADPGDRNGAGLRLMRLGAIDLAGMRPTYVKALFDQYAPRFDAALLDDLGYRGPALLLAAVAITRTEAGRPASFGRVIDLGCGTGLAARAFTEISDEIIGIDLSPKMIERARLTGLYAELVVAEIVEGLRGRPTRLSRSRARGRRHGLRARHGAVAGRGRARAGTGRHVRLHGRKPCRRRASCSARGCATSTPTDGVRALIDAAGLALERIDAASSRTEKGTQVPGLVVVASKA